MEKVKVTLEVAEAIEQVKNNFNLGAFTKFVDGEIRRLAALQARVEGGINSPNGVKLRLNTSKSIVPTVSKISGLGLEKKANEISAIIFDKIERSYGRKLAVHFRPLYTALEEISGQPISAIHRKRVAGLDSRVFPNRKMDTVLLTLDPEYVFNFDGLAALQARVEGGINSPNGVKLRLNTSKSIVPTVSKISGLGLEKKANEISAIIFDKIERSYGRKLAVHFRPLYTALEEISGQPISAIHRKRVAGLDSRVFPNRKMDTVLLTLDPEYVFNFVRGYEFEGVTQ